MSENKPKKTAKEICLHYIGWHAYAYGAAADNEVIEAILGKHCNFSPIETGKMLYDLESDKEIEFWEGKYTSGGWIIFGT